MSKLKDWFFFDFFVKKRNSRDNHIQLDQKWRFLRGYTLKAWQYIALEYQDIVISSLLIRLPKIIKIINKKWKLGSLGVDWFKHYDTYKTNRERVEKIFLQYQWYLQSRSTN